jgi:hypothetical protein
MAIIERVTLGKSNLGLNLGHDSDFGLAAAGLPGLRIGIRSTTSSLSDYPEWNVEELYQQYRDNLITDGACS